MIEIFHRDSSAWWQFTFADDLTGTLRIPSIDCPLRRADVYRRVEFPAGGDTEKPRARKKSSQKAKAVKRKPAPPRSAAPGKKARKKK